MSFAQVNGITLHYAREGLTEGVPLVFVNSLGTDLRLWDGLLDYFDARFPILRYDKRGHGLSDCPPGPYTIRQHADDLTGLLAYLDIEKVLLVGISVGGMVALDYAARQPQSVGSLVLCDTAALIGPADVWTERIAALRAGGIEPMSEAILARWFVSDFATRHPAEYQGYANMLVRTPLEGYIATCEALRDADLRQAAPTIEVSTLVLCGEDDLATPPDLARGLAESLPDARFELIPQAAHLTCVEQPALMAARLSQFLKESGYGG